MLKASALSLVRNIDNRPATNDNTPVTSAESTAPVTQIPEPAAERPEPDLSWIVRNKQNMIIESVSDNGDIPDSITDLALRLSRHDAVIRDIINDLRNNYVTKRADFRIMLANRSKEERELILSILQDMYGIISQLYHSQGAEMITGRIILSPKAQNFITGQYMEIALYKRVSELVEQLAKKHNTKGSVYRNVVVATKEGLLKNEFDLVIEFNGVFYVLEIKSGKNFREFDKYMQIGREYQIVPRRFLLVNNYLTDRQASNIEYFCDYYVTNLSGDSLEKKLTLMIENDL